MRIIFLVLMSILMTKHGFGQDKCPIKPAELKPSINLERQSLLGELFPTIGVKNLKNEKLDLPTFLNGKPSVIFVLFTDRGRPVANPWTEYINNKYKSSEVNIIEIAMLSAGLKILRGTIEKGMRKEVENYFHNNYTTYFGRTKAYKKGLMMNDKNSCYIFLLDEKGIIKYTNDGYIDANKIKMLENKVAEIKAIQLNPNYKIAKDTIRFVFDPLCGFCYAFEPEMAKLVSANKNKFVFDIISGGMIIGNQEGPISTIAPHIIEGAAGIEKISTSKFGDKFLNGLLKEGTYKMSSELPSIAVTVFKSLQPQNAIAFASDVQKMFYYDGISLNEPNNYKPLIEKYDLDTTSFIKMMTSEEWKSKTYEQFKLAEKSGIEGFPSLILIQNGTELKLTNGFVKYEDLIRRYPFD
jgi:putative protein-disulfide isomerase